MQLQKTKNALKLTAENDFNIATAESVRQQLLQVLQDNDKKNIVLVFEEADRVDEAGLKVLIGLYRDCLRQGLKLSLDIKNPDLIATLELCNVDQLITIKEK